MNDDDLVWSLVRRFDQPQKWSRGGIRRFDQPQKWSLVWQFDQPTAVPKSSNGSRGGKLREWELRSGFDFEIEPKIDYRLSKILSQKFYPKLILKSNPKSITEQFEVDEANERSWKNIMLWD